jgi:GGDEF domain-containing protein
MATQLNDFEKGLLSIFGGAGGNEPYSGSGVSPAQSDISIPPNTDVSSALDELVNSLPGVSRESLSKVISYESGWKPDATNPRSGAKGLIQFLPSTARSMGYADANDIVVKHPDIISQLRGPVKQYLQNAGRIKNDRDLYLSIFYPAGKDQGDDTVLPKDVREKNPGIVTVGDYWHKVADADSSIPDKNASSSFIDVLADIFGFNPPSESKPPVPGPIAATTPTIQPAPAVPNTLEPISPAAPAEMPRLRPPIQPAVAEATATAPGYHPRTPYGSEFSAEKIAQHPIETAKATVKTAIQSTQSLPLNIAKIVAPFVVGPEEADFARQGIEHQQSRFNLTPQQKDLLGKTGLAGEALSAASEMVGQLPYFMAAGGEGKVAAEALIKKIGPEALQKGLPTVYKLLGPRAETFLTEAIGNSIGFGAFGGAETASAGIAENKPVSDVLKETLSSIATGVVTGPLFAGGSTLGETLAKKAGDQIANAAGKKFVEASARGAGGAAGFTAGSLPTNLHDALLSGFLGFGMGFSSGVMRRSEMARLDYDVNPTKENLSKLSDAISEDLNDPATKAPLAGEAAAANSSGAPPGSAGAPPGQERASGNASGVPDEIFDRMKALDNDLSDIVDPATKERVKKQIIDPLLGDYGVTRKPDFEETMRQLDKGDHSFIVEMDDGRNQKGANDKFGYQGANEFMRQIWGDIWAKRTKENGGIPFRWGGDELAALWPHKTIEEVTAIREAIDKEISAKVDELGLSDIENPRYEGKKTGALYLEYGLAAHSKGEYGDTMRKVEVALKERKAKNIDAKLGGMRYNMGEGTSDVRSTILPPIRISGGQQSGTGIAVRPADVSAGEKQGPDISRGTAAQGTSATPTPGEGVVSGINAERGSGVLPESPQSARPIDWGVDSKEQIEEALNAKSQGLTGEAQALELAKEKYQRDRKLYRLTAYLKNAIDTKAFGDASDPNVIKENSRWVTKRGGMSEDAARESFVARYRKILPDLGISEESLDQPGAFVDLLRNVKLADELKTTRAGIPIEEKQLDAEFDKHQKEWKEFDRRWPIKQDQNAPIEEFSAENPNLKFSTKTGDLFAGTPEEAKIKRDLARAEIMRRAAKAKEQKPLTDLPLFDKESGTTQQTDMFSGTGASASVPHGAGQKTELSGKAATVDADTEKKREVLRGHIPEIVELLKMAGEGKSPKIARKLRMAMARALGVFRHGGAIGPSVSLRADIWIGPMHAEFKIRNALQREAKIKEAVDALKAKGVAESDIIIKTEKGTTRIYERDPDYAAKIASHELGHWIDYLPAETLKHGNILGRIASLHGYYKEWMAGFPGGPEPLSRADEARLRKIAKDLLNKPELMDQEIGVQTKYTPEEIMAVWNSVDQSKIDPKLYDYIARLSTAEKKSIVLEAIKDKVPDNLPLKGEANKKIKPGATPEEIAKKYHELILEEARKRKLLQASIVRQELIDASKEWNPFDPKDGSNYTKYRLKGEELYADAFSMLMNDPGRLQEIAPNFMRGYFAYADRKPQVKALYDEIQNRMAEGPEAVLAHREATLRADIRAGEEKFKAKAGERAKPAIGLWEGVKKALWDKATRVIDYTKQRVKAGDKINPEDNPIYKAEERQYVTAPIHEYFRSVENSTILPLAKLGVTEEDVALFMQLRRAATERAMMANPEGIGGKYAEDQLAHLKKGLGEEKYAAIEKYVGEYWKVRKEQSIPMMKESGQYSDEQMRQIEDNKNYATFLNLEKMYDDAYGSSGVAVPGAIKHQIGMLAGTPNVFTLTILKDIALMRSAMRVEAIKTFAQTFKSIPGAVKPSETRWDKNTNSYKIIETHDPKLQTVTMLVKGKVVGFDMDRELAEIIDNPNAASNALTGAIASVQRPFKEILTSKNPFFQARNLIRDTINTAINVKGATLTKTIRYMLGSVPDVLKDVLKNESTPTVARMYRNKELISNRIWGGKDINAETELDRMVLSIGNRKIQFEKKVINPFSALMDALDKSGKIGERLVKIAGDKMVRDLNPNMSEEEIGHIVRALVGSPDFMRGGFQRFLLNSVLLFSNAGKEGWRSSIEAFSGNKAGYTAKLMLYSIAPKIAMRVAAAGLMGAAIKGLYDNIPENDKTNYHCIPFGKTDKGKTVYFVIPADFTGQSIGAVAWKLMTKPGDVGGILNTAFSQLPGQSTNPLISTFMAWNDYRRGINPTDSWTKKEIVDPTSFRAGQGVGDMITWTLDEMGLGVYARRESVKRALGAIIPTFKEGTQQSIESQFEKIYGIPIIGRALNTFIRVSDAGKQDKIRETYEQGNKTTAQRSIERTNEIRKSINQLPAPSKNNFRSLFLNMKKEATHRGERFDRASFKRVYDAATIARFGSTEIKAIYYAPTKDARSAVIDELLKEKQMPDAAKKSLKRRLMQPSVVARLKEPL